MKPKKKKKNKLPRTDQYEPTFVDVEQEQQIADPQPGLPSISKLDPQTSQGRNKLWGQIHEGERMRSKPFDQILEDRLNEEFSTVEMTPSNDVLQNMIDNVQYGFQSREQFRSYLTEGTLLNINKLASTYIGLPAGEYVVWNISPHEAALMPTSIINDDVFSESPQPKEVHMQKLLSVWDKVSKSLYEDDRSEKDKPSSQRFSKKERQQRSKSKYPRNTKVVGAYEASGESQEEIADHCGVDPSTISRIKNKSGAGSRNPSIDTAVCVAKSTGQSVEDMFSNK
jgi:DNA-binding XRE family transcriptional regulator